MNKDNVIQETKVASISIFKTNKKATYIYHKVERLSAALYIISELFENKEPMKWSLREVSLELVKTASNVFNNMSDTDHKKSIEKVSVSFLNVLSLVNVSYASGLISEMNYDVLKKEFEESLQLVSVLYEQKNDQTNEVSNALTRSFFDVSFGEDQSSKLYSKPKFGSQRLVANEPKKESDIGGLRSHFQSEKIESISRDNVTGAQNNLLENAKVDSVKSTSDFNPNKITSPTLIGETDSSAQSKTSFSFKGHVKDIRSGKAFESPVINSFKSTNRNELIISMLRSQGPLTVKDFSLKITDCSEKTIQRLLNTMVLEGSIKRVGERRWSRYML